MATHKKTCTGLGQQLLTKVASNSIFCVNSVESSDPDSAKCNILFTVKSSTTTGTQVNSWTGTHIKSSGNYSFQKNSVDLTVSNNDEIFVEILPLDGTKPTPVVTVEITYSL